MVWGLILIVWGFTFLALEHREWYKRGSTANEYGLRTVYLSGACLLLGIIIVCLKFEGIL